jgi:hypothetical protein
VHRGLDLGGRVEALDGDGEFPGGGEGQWVVGGGMQGWDDGAVACGEVFTRSPVRIG